MDSAILGGNGNTQPSAPSRPGEVGQLAGDEMADLMSKLNDIEARRVELLNACFDLMRESVKSMRILLGTEGKK